MADELTVGDAIKMARDAGLPADAMRAQFKANTGLDLDRVNPHWTLDRIRRIREMSRSQGANQARNAKPWLQSVAEDVAVGVAGLPAMALGAAGQTLGTAALGAAQEQMGGREAGELAASSGVLGGVAQRNKDAAAEAMRVVEERRGIPALASARRDAADILSGGHQLLSLAVGAAPHEGQREPGMLDAIGAGIADRYRTGQQLAAGAIGGTVGQYVAAAQDPAAAVSAQPVTWAMEALPLVGRIGAAAKAASASARAGRFADVAATAAEAASPGPAGRVDITQSVPRQLTERAKADALALKQRVDQGLLTPEQAGAIMEQRFPGLVGPVSAALTSAGDMVAKGASALQGATAGAVFGDLLPGGPLVGAALGAVAPGLAKRALDAVPAGVAASVSRRFQDPNAQQTPQETVRARQILEPSRHGRGAVVAATERAGGRMEQGAELSREAERVPVPAPGTVLSEVTLEGVVRPPRAESFGRDAVSEMVGQQAAEVGLRQDVAAALRQTIKQIDDPERVKRLQEAVVAEQRAVSGDRKTKAPGLKQELAQTLRPSDDSGKFVPDTPFREREVDEAAGLKTPVGQSRRVVVSSDPALERSIGDVHELVNQGGLKERFTREEVGRWVTEPMNADSLTILRDPGMRGLVEARLVAEMEPKAAAAVRAQMDDAIVNLNRHALSDQPDVAVLRLPDGREVNTRDLAASIRAELAKTPEGRAKVAAMMRSAIRRVGVHLAAQAEQTALARSLQSEFQRTHVDQSIVQDAQIPTKDAMRAVARGEPLPMMMTVDPREAAARMAAHPGVVAGELGLTKAQVQATAKRMAEDYMMVPDGPVMDFLRQAEQRGDIELPTGRLFVTRGFHESLRNRVEGITSFRQAADFHMKASQAMKLGFTAYNPVTHINNVTSNLVYQSMRLGHSPLRVMADWRQAASEWKAYLAGKPVQNERAMRALAKTGFAATDALDAELSALSMAPAKSIPGVASKIAQSVKKVGEVAQHVYKLGDNIPKLHEATRAFTEIDSALQQMAPGSTIVLDTEKGTKVVLRKTADGAFETPGGKTLRHGDQKLDDIVAQAAIRPALDIFHDYGDAPLYLSALKRHGVTGMASPFYTWFFKSMDRPGHKGLVHHMLAYAGGAPYWTDDAALSAARAEQAVTLAAKRTAMLSASRNLLHEDRDELRQDFGFTPRGMGIMDMRAVPDSLNFYDVNSWESANPFAATDALWRMGGSAIAQAVGAIPAVRGQMFPETADGKPVTPGMAKLRYLWSKQKTGEWFAPEDALAVIGQSGGTMLAVIKAVDDARRNGEELDTSKLGLLFLRGIVGGGLASVADVVAGAADPGSPLTTRRPVDMMSPDFDREGAMLQHERVGDMMTRKLLSLGSRAVSRDEAAEWREKKRQAFLDSLDDAMEKRAEEVMLTAPAGATKEQLLAGDAVWQALFRMGMIAGQIELDEMERGFTVGDKARGAK